MATTDLELELDRLYSLPLADFIAGRNGLAKRLRSDGDRETADEVKTLAKPSVTAWAVNALYHHERAAFDRLTDAAAAVRRALAGKGDRRQADAARRRALRDLLGSAAKILAQAGHAATPANRQRISHTLEALAARDPAAQGPPPGRLAADLEPQGFDVLAGLAGSLAPTGPSSASRPRTDQRSSERKTARHKRQAAARRKVEEQQAALSQLERDLAATAAAAAAATDRHEQLAEEAAEAERRARHAAAAVAAAKEEVAAAKAAAAKAKAAQRRGLSRLDTARRQLERHRD